MIDTVAHATILCKFCGKRASVSSAWAIALDARDAAEFDHMLDAATYQEARRTGIYPVRLPHASSSFDRVKWLCTECATCVLQAFSIDVDGRGGLELVPRKGTL